MYFGLHSQRKSPLQFGSVWLVKAKDKVGQSRCNPTCERGKGGLQDMLHFNIDYDLYLLVLVL